MSGLERLSPVLYIALLVAYPFLVYFGLSHWAPKTVAWALLALAAPLLVLRLALARRKLGRIALLPLITIGCLALAAIFDAAAPVLMVPVAISGALLLLFGRTLFWGPPMIERFARMQHDTLTPDERAWCRLWTWLWCGFFAFNAAVAWTLGWLGATTWWRNYTGLWSYVLMAMLFVVEYAVRKYRFGRWSGHVLDRALLGLFARIRGERDA